MSTFPTITGSRWRDCIGAARRSPNLVLAQIRAGIRKTSPFVAGSGPGARRAESTAEAGDDTRASDTHLAPATAGTPVQPEAGR